MTVLLFFWLPFEDMNLISPIIAGAMICTWIAAYLQVRINQTMNPITLGIGTGTLAGLVTPAVSVVVMLLKVGLHDHVTPDYTNQQLFDVLARTPYWGAGGFLIGLGVGLWRFVNQGV